VLTKKGKYGLKAMVHLAGLEPGELAQVANIAETNSISKKFLDHILGDLRHAGLALQLRILLISESMGHHDSEIVDDRGIDRDDA
jgi:Iron-dependent Transcriptional regulator